jgi:uncharacterized protein (UPF0276 family)
MAAAHTAARPGPVPADAGIGLRAVHYQEVLETMPNVGWLEVHSENYFGEGGSPHAYLTALRDRYPVSLHGVGLSLGSTDPLSHAHLHKLKGLIQRYEPCLVSEHLSWGSIGGRYFNDLLPLPYTEESLGHIAERISATQEFLDRRILLENPSTYLAFACSAIPEAEFLAELARRTGCGILLDVNNLHVSARNHGLDPHAYLAAVPAAAVAEIHLAGFSINRFDGGEILIDTHSRPVFPAVWALYQAALARLGPVPTLIEWDTDLPPLPILLGEAGKAQRLLDEARHALAA